MIIRDLSGMEEFFKAEQLQRDVWGAGDTEDPADLMMVIQHEGGLVASQRLELAQQVIGQGQDRVSADPAAEDDTRGGPHGQEATGAQEGLGGEEAIGHVAFSPVLHTAHCCLDVGSLVFRYLPFGHRIEDV